MSPLRALVLSLALAAPPALAHHGWSWATDEEFSLTGTILEAELGNPHGLLTVQAGEEVWTIEVGQPWRNIEAGLTDDMLVSGVELTAEGHRSADPSQLVMKAERIIIDGQTYNLYPDRA